MRHVPRLTVLAFAAALTAGAAPAQTATNPAVVARQSVMELRAFYLAQLGAMAKEVVPYDAALASRAAANLALLGQLDQSAMWPPGTDSDSDSTSRALPALWANPADLGARSAALAEAVAAMEVAAGTDLAALQAAMSQVGGACGACHKAYRAPDE